MGAPLVQVVTPLPNAQVSVSQTVYVVISATSEQTITRVQLYDDATLVRTESLEPPLQTLITTIPWTPAHIGAHTLRVVAFDSDNRASAPEEVVVSVTPDTRRPTANIVYPLSSTQIELGGVLQVYAVATDEVGVRQMDLWVDNQLYTYVTSPKPLEQPALTNVFAWRALSAGNHSLVLRAHDTQGQTTDSPPLRVFVGDTHAPALSVTLDRTNTPIGEPISITVTALDVSGIQRIELWTGKEMSTTIASGSPARQTSMSVQIPWQHGSPGDYALTVRAYNANGNSKESPVQTVSVLRANQSTPTRAPTTTPTRTRAPRATATPRLQPPSAPRADITQPNDRLTGPWPLKITFNGHGDAELERIELWGYYQDQPSPQVICSIEAQATTYKSAQCEWSPPTAGMVFVYAQAIDTFGQSGRSKTLSGYVEVPTVPTPTPTPASLAGRWSATVPAGQQVVVFRPIVTSSGIALRGDFRIVSSATPPTETAGRIVSGLVKGDRVTFRVDFAPLSTATPSPAPITATPGATGAPSPTSEKSPTTSTSVMQPLDFDCTVDAGAVMLDCKFKDSRGQGGAATFRREP